MRLTLATLHHNKPRTTIPKSFFMKLLYIFLGSLWTQSNSYKSISSVSTQFQLLMNLLRQKVSFLIKLFLKNPSERRWRLWTDGYAILYECTALISWATGPCVWLMFTRILELIQVKRYNSHLLIILVLLLINISIYYLASLV